MEQAAWFNRKSHIGTIKCPFSFGTITTEHSLLKRIGEKISMKKIIRRIATVVLILVVVIAGIGYAMFHGELKTLSTITKLSDYPLYEMTFKSNYYLDDYMEEGAATDDELANFVTKKILKIFPSVEANPDAACSTFCATTPENEVIMARNFDYTHSTCLIVHTNPDDAYHSISMVNLCHIGYGDDKQPDSLKNKMQLLAAPYIVLDGMNEKGLALGVLVVDEQVVHQDTGKTPVTTTAALRMILDKCATVEEAIELLQTVDMNSSGSTGYHFQVTDATGDSAVIEYIDNEMQVVRKGDQSYLAATNFTLSTTEQNGGGKDRYEIITNALEKKNGTATEEEAFSILYDAHFDGEAVSGGDPSDRYYDCATQWSVVYNLTEHTMKLCVGLDYDTVYEFTVE